MKCVIQRVSGASLVVEGAVRAEFGTAGLVVLAGFARGDTDADYQWAGEKVVNMRIFPDGQGKMNLSVLDIAGEVLLVPNFTLAGDASRGRRPSFDGALEPELAAAMFERFAGCVRGLTAKTQTGVFGAHMQLSLTNNGPVTIVLDSRDRGR